MDVSLAPGIQTGWSVTGVLLITGGSRGIGAATARLAARQGYTVAVNYHEREDAAERVLADIRGLGADGVTVQGDVAVESDVQDMFRLVEQRLGPIRYLVNSAGVAGGQHRVSELDAESLGHLFAVNVIGAMLCCREAVRRMVLPDVGGGAIVNVSSMAATIGGRAGSSHYAASKAAVDAYTVGLAKEVGELGIRANVVRPGMTLTDMTEDLRHDDERLARVAGTIGMNRIASVEEIANPIVWLLSEQASFVSGCCLDAAGGGFIVGDRMS